MADGDDSPSVPPDDDCNPVEVATHTIVARVIDGEATLVGELPGVRPDLVTSDSLGGVLVVPSGDDSLRRYDPDGSMAVAASVGASVAALDGRDGLIVYAGLGDQWEYGALDSGLAPVWGPHPIEEQYPDSLAVGAAPGGTAALAFVEFAAEAGDVWSLGADGLPVWTAQWPAFAPIDAEADLRVVDVFAFDTGVVVVAFGRDGVLHIEAWAPDGQPLWSLAQVEGLLLGAAPDDVPVVRSGDHIVVLTDGGGEGILHYGLSATGELAWQSQLTIEFDPIAPCGDRIMIGDRAYGPPVDGELAPGEVFTASLSALELGFDDTVWTSEVVRVIPRCLPGGGFTAVAELSLTHRPQDACIATGSHDGSGG